MKKILNKKEWIIIGVLIILLISVPFIIGVAVKVHEWDKPISIDNWLIYYATISGALIGGFITALGLYITIKQTREIQKENKKEIKIERNLNKYKIEIDYLKNLYQVSYDYEKYMTNNLEKKMISVINGEKNPTEVLDSIFIKIGDYNRNIMIESSCIQVAEISELVEIISNLECDFLIRIGNIFEKRDDYTEKKISGLFSDENEKIVILIKLLLTLNSKIAKQIKKTKNQFDDFCK